MGMARSFTCAKELQKKIDLFFESIIDDPVPPTVTDLAIFLDIHRDTLNVYVNKTEVYGVEMSDIFKKAKLKIESKIWRQSFQNKCNVTAAIFALKVLHGLRDQTYVQQENVNVERKYTKKELSKLSLEELSALKSINEKLSEDN